MENPTTTEEVLKEIGNLKAESKWTRLCAVNIQGKPDWGRWAAQYEAIKFVRDYLRKDREFHKKAALVRMPTGSGKTGVMAVAANYFKEHYEHKSCLIVVPSTYLTGQIARAINKDYWATIEKRPNKPVPAIVFLPSTINDLLEKCTGPTAFICTQKALSDIYNSDEESSDYQGIKERIGVVFVDEGHREPAPIWSKAVRSFEKPTVLFSATPYRNDLRMFRIGRSKNGYRHSLTYPKALEVGLVRAIKQSFPRHPFCQREGATGVIKRDEHRFAKELMRFYQNVLLKRKPESIETARVIVRCHSQTSVEKIQNALTQNVPRKLKNNLGEGSIIAIHHEFVNKESEWKFTHPPKPGKKGSNAIFWVHQFKLAEGIDNNEFCCIAFFEPFDNARSLVQQIGRIVRNPSGSTSEKGFVFSDRIDRLDEQWSGYMEFEKANQDIIGAEDIVESIREAQPKWFYADKKYRQGVEFDVEDYWHDIRVPATAQVYVRPANYGSENLRSLSELVDQQIELRDITHAKTLEKSLGNGKYSITTFYWKIHQSYHFFEQGFFDVNLLVSHLFMNQTYIFYQGLVTLEKAYNSGPEKIEVENLLSALPVVDSQIKELSLINWN